MSFSIHTYMTELNKVLVQHISTKQIVAISPEVRKHVHEDRIGQFLSEGDPRNIRCVGYVCFYHRGNFSPLQIHHFESGVKTTACSQHRCFLFQDLHGFFLYTHSLFGLLTLGSLFVVAKSQAIKWPDKIVYYMHPAEKMSNNVSFPLYGHQCLYTSRYYAIPNGVITSFQKALLRIS